MLRFLDNIYSRFDQAWTVFKNPDIGHNAYLAGIEVGKMIARVEVNNTLASFSPDDFSNQHFKLGYYYAAETAKKVMENDADHTLD